MLTNPDCRVAKLVRRANTNLPKEESRVKLAILVSIKKKRNPQRLANSVTLGITNRIRRLVA